MVQRAALLRSWREPDGGWGGGLPAGPGLGGDLPYEEWGVLGDGVEPAGPDGADGFGARFAVGAAVWAGVELGFDLRAEGEGLLVEGVIDPADGFEGGGG